MRTDSELMAAANENFVASYRKLVEHCPDGDIHEAGGVFAFVTGIPMPLFNGCIVVAPATSTQLEEVLDWLARRGLPHRVWIDESIRPGLGHVLQARGFQRDERPYPNMVLHPIPLSREPPVAVTVVPVTPAGFDEFLAVSIEGGMPPDAARHLFSASFAGDPDVRLFTGRLEGRAVGTAVAIRSGDVSGIYAVGTTPPARRHGVGTALTWAAVEADRAWGCDTIALQASEIGYPIYAAMGFRTVVSYGEYARPAPD
jgi:GNAT superfamily N-acetyltransferase